MRTKDRLASELLKSSEAATEKDAKIYRSLAQRASTGEFDDFSDAHVCGVTALHAELVSAGFNELADRVASGEFDSTPEESAEWANSVNEMTEVERSAFWQNGMNFENLSLRRMQ